MLLILLYVVPFLQWLPHLLHQTRLLHLHQIHLVLIQILSNQTLIQRYLELPGEHCVWKRAGKLKYKQVNASTCRKSQEILRINSFPLKYLIILATQNLRIYNTIFKIPITIYAPIKKYISALIYTYFGKSTCKIEHVDSKSYFTLYVSTLFLKERVTYITLFPNISLHFFDNLKKLKYKK